MKRGCRSSVEGRRLKVLESFLCWQRTSNGAVSWCTTARRASSSRSACSRLPPGAPARTTSIGRGTSLTKQKVDITLRGGESLDEADFQRRPIKYMYADADNYYFLDQSDYNQYGLPKEDLEEESQYFTENLEGMQALIYNGECIGIQVPLTVTLVVVECDPGIKGASATSRTKPAKLETGLVVQVPEYLTAGETIKIDTRTGEYLVAGVGDPCLTFPIPPKTNERCSRRSARRRSTNCSR